MKALLLNLVRKIGSYHRIELVVSGKTLIYDTWSIGICKHCRIRIGILVKTEEKK